MFSWGKILAGLVGIVQWFQEQFRLSEARQNERDKMNVETFKKIETGRKARDLVDTDADYAAKLLKELSPAETVASDDGQLLQELRTRLHSARDSGNNPAWYIKELFNVPDALHKYTGRSLGNLETCHGELQLVCLELSKRVNATAIEGTRSMARQQELFDSGASQVGPGQSKHNRFPSDAVDIVPAEAPKLWAQKKDLPSRDYYEFAEIFFEIAGHYGIAIRWGGDWDGDKDYSDQSFNDFAHFERL